MALVFGVMTFSMSSARALSVRGSTSQSTIFAPAAHTALPAPTKLMVGRMTSSPGLMLKRYMEENRPSLQQFVDSTCSRVVLRPSAYFSSNSATRGPFPIQFEAKVFSRASSSSRPNVGCMTLIIIFSYLKVFIWYRRGG